MEKLTWKEIQEKYPDQWVGLIDVEFESNNKSTIKSAIVKYPDRPRDDLDELVITENIISIYTTPDNVFQLGVLGGI